jgi:hypothetical protein
VYERDDVRLEVAFLDHGEWPRTRSSTMSPRWRGSCACRQPVVVEGRQGAGA